MEQIKQNDLEQQRLSEIVAIQRDVAHAHHDLQLAMDLIAERTHKLTDADSSVIEILEGNEMVYRAASGRAANFIGLRIKAQGSLSGLCVRENQILRCDNAETDPRVDKEACRKIGVTSMLVLPLTRNKQAVGVLKVLSGNVAAFNEQHVVMLEILAGVLSAAFSDALVYDTLRQSEEIFRSSMENSPMGMALVTLEGRWFKVNNALCTLLGYTAEEFAQMDFRAVTHPGDIAISNQKREQMIAGIIKRNEYQKRYIHRDGHTVWVQIYSSIVRDAEGKPQYFIAQIEDITARREVESLKNEFISVVSHELRTPLTSIHASLGLLVNLELSQDTAELVDIAHKNSARLVRLINNILDIEKAESGKMVLDLKPISVPEFLKLATDANQAYAKKYNVKFVIGDCVTAKVMADQDRLMQIATNLLSNAAKFSPSESSVTFSAYCKDGKICFEVTDHGDGIPEKFQPHIFGKFSQSDSSDTRQHDGTGLGLNISKQLVELMNGEIGFRSNKGKGTTFYFNLPEAV